MGLLSNHFKVAWRVSVRQKWYTALNVLGLAAGMSCCLFILLYVNHELSYDSFHRGSESIYRIVWKGIGKDAQSGKRILTPGALKKSLVNDIPEVEQATHFHRSYWGKILLSNDRYEYFDDSFLYADASFFKVFTFEFIHGNPQLALSDPTSIVLTEHMVKSFSDTLKPLERP